MIDITPQRRGVRHSGRPSDAYDESDYYDDGYTGGSGVGGGILWVWLAIFVAAMIIGNIRR